MDNLKPPEELDIHGSNKAEQWKQFRERFAVYSVASGLSSKSQEVQAAVFLHVIGSEAHRVYNTFEFDDEGDRKKINKLLEKFENYCLPKKNITLERYSLFTRRQRQGESFDEFITDLRRRASRCEFPATLESILKDCIVMGTSDEKLRERLIRDNVESLDKALNMCRASEQCQGHLKLLRQGKVNDTSELPVEPVCPARTTNDRSGLPMEPVRRESARASVYDCRFCGGTHKRGMCPAFGKSCRACGKQNHFAKVCRSKKLSLQTVGLAGEASSSIGDVEEKFFFSCCH